MKKPEELNNICSDCGVVANYLTCWKKFNAPPKKAAFDLSTFHKGVCDVCKRKVAVTEARDFFYPDFRLILDAIKLTKKKKYS